MTTEQKVEAKEVRIGFESALDRYSPEWKTEWSKNDIEFARYFYTAAVADTRIFASAAVTNLNEGYTFIQNNAETTDIDPDNISLKVVMDADQVALDASMKNYVDYDV